MAHGTIRHYQLAVGGVNWPETNKVNWDESVPVHLASAFYDIERSQAICSLPGFQLAEVVPATRFPTNYPLLSGAVCPRVCDHAMSALSCGAGPAGRVCSRFDDLFAPAAGVVDLLQLALDDADQADEVRQGQSWRWLASAATRSPQCGYHNTGGDGRGDASTPIIGREGLLRLAELARRLQCCSATSAYSPEPKETDPQTEAQCTKVESAPEQSYATGCRSAHRINAPFRAD